MTVSSHPWYHQRHHRKRGFANVWGANPMPPFFKSAFWLLCHIFKPKHNMPPPALPVDATAIDEAPIGLRATWIGHSTMLLQTPSSNILTDPVFSSRASPVFFAGPVREVDLPLDLEDLPPIDLVLVSHDHYDHLDRTSVRHLQKHHNPFFLVPLGVGRVLQRWGVRRVVELDWWQYVKFDRLRIHCVPARHFSGRGLTRDGTLWSSWYLDATPTTPALYYAGDTAYANHFALIRERLGPPDVVLMPIGAYTPRWFMETVHVTPEEALQAFIDTGGTHLLPVHWGTFDLAGEPLQEPPTRLARAASEHGVSDRVHRLDIGGSFRLAARATSTSVPSAQPGRSA